MESVESSSKECRCDSTAVIVTIYLHLFVVCERRLPIGYISLGYLPKIFSDLFVSPSFTHTADTKMANVFVRSGASSDERGRTSVLRLVSDSHPV